MTAISSVGDLTKDPNKWRIKGESLSKTFQWSPQDLFWNPWTCMGSRILVHR